MKQTSAICSTFIPEKLIEHLWSIIDEYNDSDYVFILSSRRLGDRMVQDLTVFRERGISKQTILGYKPVDLTVGVSRKGNDYLMSLIPSLKATYEISKWKRVASGFFFQKKRVSEPAPHHFRLRSAC